VAKGNPLGLKGLADLAKPGLRVGLMDARYSTCGQMVQDALKRRGLTDKVGPNVRVEKRSHQELATDVTLGSLDAAAVWNFSAVLNREKLDAVPTGETFPETRLCICLLRSAANPKGAGRFTELCASEFGREVFSRHGYSKGMGAKPQQ
jgi:molybdate transport system substrate-binding protein